MTSNSKPNSENLFLARIRSLAVPLILFAGLLMLHVSSYAYADLLPFVLSAELFQVITAGLWIAGICLINRIIDVVLWDGIKRVRGHSVPGLLRDLVATIIWFCGFCGIIVFVFDKSITSILTASAVIMGVIGFTLNHFILDAFAGVVIGLQRPFKEGDWLQFDEAWGVGRVVEINWRAVRLVTPDEITFLVSNSQLIDNYLKIYSQPELFFRDEIRITLPYTLTTYQSQRILLGAANQVEVVAAIPRTSIVSIVDYTERGVLWRLLYWCPSPGQVPIIRFKVNQNIMRNLYYVGIQIPAPMRVVQHLPPLPAIPEDEVDIDKMLARIPLFSGLTNQELCYLSLHTKTRLFLAGHPVLRQGEPGDSLFILREGLLAVQITSKNDTELEVARISSGQFFGERSLLLGEVRSATVVPVVDSTVSEITKQTMAKLLHDRPEITTYLSEVLSERIANRDKMEAMSIASIEENHSITKLLLNRIRAFFGLTE